MQVEVVPAILVHSFEGYKRRLSLVEGLVKTVQLDGMDGKFVPNQTFADAEMIKSAETPLAIEAHLMVEDPQNWIERYKEGPIKRLIFHIESTEAPEALIQGIKDGGFEVGVTLNPETSISRVWDHLPKVDLFQVMGVNPGFSGQEFQEVALSKISEARKEFPDLNISVDGGVNPQTAPRIIEAGANILCSGSFIFESGDVGKAIEELKLASSN